jgi:outer membrane protein
MPLKLTATLRWLHQRRHLLAALAVMVLGLLLSWPAARAAEAQNLLQVYDQARAADPLLAAAAAQRGAQREATTQARARLLPQWQLSGTDSRAQDSGSRSHELGSNLTQVLFDLGRLRTLDAERTLESAQEARVRAAEQALAARVARAYFGVLSAQAALATATVNEHTLAMQAQQAQSRFESGLAALVDVEQSRTYHALARGNTVQARQALADARAALAQITGRAPGALKPLAAALPAVPPQPADAAAWIERAQQGNPNLQALALALDASERRIGAARAAHGPSLSASVDTRMAGGPAIAEAERGRSTTLVAVRLTVPLFAGGATESGVRQAAFQRDAAREELEAARRALTRETQAQHEAVLAGVALLESTAAAVAAADRALAAMRTGQALGTRSNTDLLLAIQNQAAARNANDQARHGYVLARLLLQQAAGSLGLPELTAVNALLDQETADAAALP